jgi:hypothetical protein
MNCPNCDLSMKISGIVIYTFPETLHYYCACGLVLDVRDGSRTKICCCLGDDRLTQEQRDKVNLALASVGVSQQEDKP